jgi:hypothetical protein
MQFEIVRNDITKIAVDAVVLPSMPSLECWRCLSSIQITYNLSEGA